MTIIRARGLFFFFAAVSARTRTTATDLFPRWLASCDWRGLPQVITLGVNTGANLPAAPSGQWQLVRRKSGPAFRAPPKWPCDLVWTEVAYPPPAPEGRSFNPLECAWSKTAWARSGHGDQAAGQFGDQRFIPKADIVESCRPHAGLFSYRPSSKGPRNDHPDDRIHPRKRLRSSEENQSFLRFRRPKCGSVVLLVKRRRNWRGPLGCPMPQSAERRLASSSFGGSPLVQLLEEIDGSDLYLYFTKPRSRAGTNCLP